MSIQADTDAIPVWTLGDRLRKAREHAGIRRELMADQLGVTPGAISHWENDRQRPRDLVEVVRRWSDLTGVPAPWLLGLVGTMTCSPFPERRIGTNKYDGPERRRNLSAAPLQLVAVGADS